jgi:flagella basal body P-ring formation protein FlgA
MRRIVESSRQNISANRTGNDHLFGALGRVAPFYSADMEAFPIRPLPSRLARGAGLALFMALAFGLLAHEARAQDAPAAVASGLDAGLEQQVRSLALGGAAPAMEGVTRVEVIVGQLDPRLRLAPCQKVEPYLPNGARLWGKSRIGLRCVQGPSAWNVYLPITIKAYGRALVATTGAGSGSVLKAGDVAQAEVDLAEDMTPALVEPEQAVGRTLAQALKPGQSIRQGSLKARVWFAAGDTVKLVALGAGFSLEGEGQALSNGIEGQPARVRTENGRILTGNPTADRRVELAL